MSAAIDNIPPKARITNKTFRLRPAAKRILALLPFADAETRAAYRHAMIEAQVAANTIFKGKDRPSPSQG